VTATRPTGHSQPWQSRGDRRLYSCTVMHPPPHANILWWRGSRPVRPGRTGAGRPSRGTATAARRGRRGDRSRPPSKGISGLSGFGSDTCAGLVPIDPLSDAHRPGCDHPDQAIRGSTSPRHSASGGHIRLPGIEVRGVWAAELDTVGNRRLRCARRPALVVRYRPGWRRSTGPRTAGTPAGRVAFPSGWGTATSVEEPS
jgi:hypothetical protein